MRREHLAVQNDQVASLIEEAKLSRGKEIFNKNAAYNRSHDGRAEFLNVQLMNLDGELIDKVI